MITESFVNLIGFNDEILHKKKKYAEDVYNLLQSSYASIGGMKGNGFTSPEDMVKSIPFWKIATYDGIPKAVIMYKDKNGRKAVAVGSDGSEIAAKFVNDIYSNEISRAYGEKSKSSLGKLMKTIPWPVLEPFMYSPENAGNVIGKDVTSVNDVDDLPDDAVFTLQKYPQLQQYGYLRNINGTPTFKIMVGSHGKSIT